MGHALTHDPGRLVRRPHAWRANGSRHRNTPGRQRARRSCCSPRDVGTELAAGSCRPRGEWARSMAGPDHRQVKRLGGDVRYEMALHLEPQYARAVLKVFGDLYEQGLIYRDNYMVNGAGPALGDHEPRSRTRGVVDTLSRAPTRWRPARRGRVAPGARAMLDETPWQSIRDERYADCRPRCPAARRAPPGIIADEYVKTTSYRALEITPSTTQRSRSPPPRLDEVA